MRKTSIIKIGLFVLCAFISIKTAQAEGSLGRISDALKRVNLQSVQVITNLEATTLADDGEAVPFDYHTCYESFYSDCTPKYSTQYCDELAKMYCSYREDAERTNKAVTQWR